MKPTILITGATGNTGLPVVRQLSERKVPFRAMVHSAAKKRLIEGTGAEIVAGDFGDAGSLDRALEGIEKAYLLSPPTPDQYARQAAFVDAAKRRGVKHIIKLSALGASPDSPVELLRAHAETEEHIARSGMAYTFLRPHFFLENLLGSVATVRKDGILYSPLGEAKISPVSVQDIAAVVAAVLTGTGHEGRTYTLTGPEAVTYARIAEILGEEISKPVDYVKVPFDDARQAMIGSGIPEWLADDLVRLMKTWAEGRGEIVSPDIQIVTGRPAMDVRGFFRRHRHLFKEVA